MWTLGRVLRITVLLANLPSPGAGAVTCHPLSGRAEVVLQRGGNQVCRALVGWVGYGCTSFCKTQPSEMHRLMRLSPDLLRLRRCSGNAQRRVLNVVRTTAAVLVQSIQQVTMAALPTNTLKRQKPRRVA